MRFFTSDHHFYHANVLTYCNRPFASVEAMTGELISLWNATVLPEDEVWYLGDFSLAAKAVPEVLPLLNGKKHLISGNHDHTHTAHHKNKALRMERVFREYAAAGFVSIQEQLELTLTNGVRVLLAHLPYSGDHYGEERYVAYRPKDSGLVQICGHVHQHWKTNGRMINVGVDVWDYKPVSEAAIIATIEEMKLL